jgi:hypothetical protein
MNDNNNWLRALLGIGAVVLIAKAISSAFDNDEEEPQSDKKVFISFAVEDSKSRDFLVGQARNKRSPFTFVDMSIKEPWTEGEWKRKCRAKIKQCDGMIVLLSNHTYHAGGARWEIKCAEEEEVPTVGMHIRKVDKYAIPPELNKQDVMEWSWENIQEFIKTL